MPYTPNVDWKTAAIPIDSSGNPLGHSGGDPVTVEITNPTASLSSVGSTMNTENADDVTPQQPALGPGNEHTRAICDPVGAQFTHPYPPQIWSASAKYTTQQADTVLHAAPGANYALYVKCIYVAAHGANTITLESGGSTFVWEYPAQAAGDGAMCSFDCPLRLTTNATLTVTTSTAEDVAVVVSGFISYVGA